MRLDRRTLGAMLVLALLLASVGVWTVAHRAEKKIPATTSEAVSGLVDRPSNPRFVPAWQFANFVHGRQPAPRFAPHVTLVIDGKSRVLTSAQAAQRSIWLGTPLDLYTVAQHYALREGGHSVPASLRMFVDSGRDFVCGGRELPRMLRARSSLWLGLLPSGHGPMNTCTFINVFLTAGRIQALVARTSEGAGYSV